jgi:hypothetical protein
MRPVAVAVSLLLLLTASGVEAWPGRRHPKLPRAIDSPIVRPKVQEGHKAGKKSGRHPSAYERHGWGLDKGVYKSPRMPQVHSWLTQTQ